VSICTVQRSVNPDNKAVPDPNLEHCWNIKCKMNPPPLSLSLTYTHTHKEMIKIHIFRNLTLTVKFTDTYQVGFKLNGTSWLKIMLVMLIYWVKACIL